jgi:hypothetical protein
MQQEAPAAPLSGGLLLLLATSVDHGHSIGLATMQSPVRPGGAVWPRRLTLITPGLHDRPDGHGLGPLVRVS